MLLCSRVSRLCFAGTAEILGEFKVKGESLIVELAQIDGGGEGVLPTLSLLAQVCEAAGFEESGVGGTCS